MLPQFPLNTFPAVFEPPPLQKPVLYTYGPGWKNQVPSFDPDCLKWQAFLTFCGVDFDLNNCNEPLTSPSGKLPFLVMPTGETLYDDQITPWLEKIGFEKKLARDAENAESTAFISLAETKLRTAFLFSFFLEPLNVTESTGAKYFGHYSTPINAIIQYQKKNAIIQRMLAKRAFLVRDEVYQDAADALLSFSTKLGDNEFFFGSSYPTFLDATVFAYLHTILAAPQSTSTEGASDATRLRELVLKHNNLVNYAKNIYKAWWVADKDN
ncbi:hypothetical protein BC937DRAFT_88054 [Endogone sp. FLAS-F59071]|nr:hypothetical protein BC937DRAFT_88054 [Endogone sp. FLAS-F59071]|eukprot:RUS19033.1 hypothetical protein BC937DRAFT_88054 [Endogone sp. FLAS-F59071]